MTKEGTKQPQYTREQQDEFLELAQLEGINRAIRILGYPTYNTGFRWAKAAGVDTSLSTLMAEARKAHTYYETEDLVKTVDDIMTSIADDLLYKNLDADSKNKLVNAMSKMISSWQTLQGKAASISESRTGDATDTHIADLISQFKKTDSPAA